MSGVRLHQSRGYTMVEILLVLGIIATIVGVGLPGFTGALRRYRATNAAREVAAQIRSARYAAVTTNRQMLVRFNCPAPGLYRFLEVTGNAGIDNDANRCAYPPADNDPATLPNADGPLSALPEGMTFGAVQDLRISTLGQIQPLAGATPAVIVVTGGQQTRQVTAAVSGRVTIQ